MIRLSSTQQLRLTVVLLFLLVLGVLLWTLFDKHATCKVLVVAEKTEAISYKYGTQQQAEIVSISLNSPLQKLFLTNIGTSKIYRIDLFIFTLAFAVFFGIENYFRIYANANPFQKTIKKLLQGIFLFLSIYFLCRGFFFIDSYNTFIDARLPKGLQQFNPNESNLSLLFFLFPIMEIYKFMMEKGKTYKEEIDMVV
jgi:hypothetical protein